MFISHIAYRSPVSDFFAGKAETYWRAVELSLFTPWFMVSFRQSESDVDDGFEVGRTLLLSDVLSADQFFAQDHGPRIKIDSVQIVTPGHMNGSDHWKMDTLRAAWSAQEPGEEGQTADLYETCDGKWYAHSMLGTPIKDLKSRSIRFVYPSRTAPQSAAA
jgi:hypothetical protein